jgi:hypothetical protein
VKWSEKCCQPYVSEVDGPSPLEVAVERISGLARPLLHLLTAGLYDLNPVDTHTA